MGASQPLVESDHHVHLYGCLTAQDLWQLGKDPCKRDEGLLAWYAQKYLEAWGVRPRVEEYWSHPEGASLLQGDYEMRQPGNFEQFQACFNLIIALVPKNPSDISVLQKVLARVRSYGLVFFEPRITFPLRWSKHQAYQCLDAYAHYLGSSKKSSKPEVKWMLSLPRDLKYAALHLSWLEQWCVERGTSEKIAGVDIAFDERGCPPSVFKTFLQERLLPARQRYGWQLTYHVGEEFSDKSMWSAIRWVYQSWELGWTRLGHCTALGVNPQLRYGQSYTEPWQERVTHLRWLLQHHVELHREGFVLELAEVRHQLKRLLQSPGQPVVSTYLDKDVLRLRLFQRAVARMLRRREVVIESCPSSNYRIGGVILPQDHPLAFFTRFQLHTVWGTDDPGVFATDWHHEARHIAEIKRAVASIYLPAGYGETNVF